MPYHFALETVVASITKVGEKWRALIRRKGFPVYCKTFPVKAQAQAWARGVESEIDAGKMPTARAVVGKVVTVGDLIDVYIDMRARSDRSVTESATEYYTLRRLKRDLGGLDVMRMTVEDVVGFCRVRADEGAGPYTINMDVSKLATVIKYAAALKSMQVPDVVRNARPLLQHLKLVASGGVRERRADDFEIEQIVQWLRQHKSPVYADAVLFAMLTAMRRSEVTRILWADVDADRRMVLVRNRKDPRKKAGNDQWVPLLGVAWDLLQRQVRDSADGRIFPLHAQTLSKYFRAACQALDIHDLRLHDMRHEGTSRYFEQGYAVQEVALITGHKSWVHLRRYTNLRPEDLHDGPARVRAARRDGDGGAAD